MINKTNSTVAEKIDSAVDYISNTELATKAKDVVSTTKEKVEDFDLSEFIQDTFKIKGNGENIEKLPTTNNNYDSLVSTQKSNASIDATSLEKNVFKVNDIHDVSDPDNDKNYLIKKTTVDFNGEDLEYSSKDAYSDGTIIYKDKDGNTIKKVNADGTVTIKGKTLHYDGTVTDSMGRILLTDGSYYRTSDDEVSVKKTDGSEYVYDESGKLTKVTDADGNYTYYKYDENGNVKTIEVNQKEQNADGTYRTTVYNNDGSYSVTDTSYEGSDEFSETVSYDKNGNFIKRETSLKDGANGQTVKTDENGKKYFYDFDGKNLEYTEEKEGYTVTKTYYDRDGSVSKVEISENGKVVETETKYSNGDYGIVDKNGNYTEYYANGTMKRTESNGNKTYYYENGQTSMEINADGSEVYYNEDGRKTSEKFSDGTTQYYNSDGSVDYYDVDMNIIKEVKADGSEVYWN